MIKRSIFKTTVPILIFLLALTETVEAQKVKITTSPGTAEILENGRPVGVGAYTLNVPKRGATFTIEVNAPGYLSQTRFYASGGSFSKTAYFQLQPDPLYTSTTQSDILNRDNTLNTKSGRTKEEAWKIIVSTVLDKFDVLEVNDERSGYLRTSWVGTNFSSNTIRVRVIVKLHTEDPLVYKIKFISEESGKNGTAFNADELYKPYNRMQKKYDGFMDELMTKLRN